MTFAARTPPDGRTAMAPEWTFADAWVLRAVNGTDAGSGSTLTDVIAAGDFLNRAILGEDEFTAAAGSLLAAGLLGADRATGRYWLTEAGQEIARRRDRGPELFHGALSGLRQLGPPARVPWPLAPGEFHRAVRDWHDRAAQLLRTRPAPPKP
jgi:hypothetical protein